MSRIAFLLTLKPILYGLFGILLSGISFPLAGVIVMQNGLIPLRYMLMHGVMLGGIFSIAFGLPVLCVTIAVNMVLVLLMMSVNRGNSQKNMLAASSTMMVTTMGLASLLSHVLDVPAKDTLDILWGSPFALTPSDLYILAAITAAIILYICLCFRQITLLFFDKDIAFSCGINVKFHSLVMVFAAALAVSAAMKIIGALLIDVLLILPVNASTGKAKSLKGLFIRSSLTGCTISLLGYFASLLFNLPVSGTMAVLAVLYYLFSALMEKLKSRRI